MEKTSKKFELRNTDDGIQIKSTILWLDAATNGQLSFLSNANAQKNYTVPQTIATEDTVKLLTLFKKRANVLKCQYNRPFSIGTLRMELLPSGGILGGASLYLESANVKLLYAPYIQTHRIPTVRQMQIKKAHTLILGAHYPSVSHSLPIRKKEKERLAELIKEKSCDGTPVTILCPILGIAQELTEFLSKLGFSVGVHSMIAKVNHIYSDSGAVLGHYTTLSSKKKCQVLIYPLPKFKSGKLPPLPNGPKIFIEDGISSHDFDTAEGFIAKFTLGLTSDSHELREVINAVKPEELYFVGNFAKAYAKEFESSAPEVHALYPNDQPTLF